MNDDFNFDEAFDSVNESVEAEKRKKQAERDAADKNEADRFERAKEFILKEVVPVLEKAKATFEARGVGVSLDHSLNYTLGHSGTAIKCYHATFRCFDPSNISMSKATSGVVNFTHDGSRLVVERSWDSRFASGLTGETPAIVVEGAKKALDYYLRSAAKLH